jgi:hypothetical protein
MPRLQALGQVFWVVLLLLGLASATASPAWAQVTAGSLSGVVTDPTGAVVPGARITVTDVTRGLDFTATTDGVGRYLVRPLPPSSYRLTVAADGFTTYVQDGITISVNQAATVDVRLALGPAVQTVEVVGAAPMLQTQDATVGQDINRTFINDLPLVGRNVYNLVFLAPGVSQAPGRTFGNEWYATNFVSLGGRNATSEILIDGVTTTTYEANTAITAPLYTPSVDAVQEYKVQQGNLSAEVGFSSNTYVNVVTRSGTNELHGSAWWFVRNDALNANNWFNNRSNIKIAPRRYNQFGATLGGPIKRDRTFFFFDFEGTRDRSMDTRIAGVPSAAMRQGDFGEICPEGFDANGFCLNGNNQLWDPYSGFYAPWFGGRENTLRIPYNNLATYTSPGNPNLAGTGYELAAVPGNLIDPVAYRVMQFYPLPNIGAPGQPGYNRFANWIGTGVNRSSNDQFDLRIDHRFGDYDNFSARVSFSANDYEGMNCFGNALDPCTQGPGSGGTRAVVLNHIHSFGPLSVLNLSYGVTRWRTYTRGIQANFPDFDPVTELGLPEYHRLSGIEASPTYYISYGQYRYAAGQSIGAQAWSVYRNGSEVHHALATLNRIQGRHEFKFGGEARVNRMNWVQSGVPGGVLQFEFNTTAQYPWWGGGDAMASFLTGVGGPGSWGEYEVPPFMSTQSPRYGAFFQDNWRVTEKLTVGLGVRYDLELPRTERYNRMNWWDFNIPQAIVVSDPVLPAGLPAGVAPQQDFQNLKGGLVFASPYQRRTANVDYNNVGPRIGISYRLTPKTVLRSGYGLFYNPTLFGTAGAGQGGVAGWKEETPWLTTYQNDGATPWGRVSDPWPITGPRAPTGNTLGAAHGLGMGLSAPLRDLNATAYTQTWSFGIQRELPMNILVDASYVGTKGTKLNRLEAGHRNYFGSWIESATESELTALRTQVPNPFYGIITDPFVGLSQPTVSAAQLLLPFPQFGGVNAYNTPWANSIYHSFHLKVDKRFSNGLQFLITYSNQKAIDDGSLSTWTGWLGGDQGGPTNPNNRRLDRSLSQYDISQIFQVSYVYDLPFGRGMRYGANWNSVLNGILGGWKTTGQWRFDTGQPIVLSLDSGQPLPTYGAQRPHLLGDLVVTQGSRDEVLSKYFANPEVVARPARDTLGTAPRTLPNVRLPGTSTAALSLFKQISLNKMREGSRLEVRAEAFNALNHPQFGCLNSTFGSADFGKLFCQANVPRDAQLGLKLYW